jgi:hypothetical protein
MQHYNCRKLSKAEEAEFWKAYLYLRNHSRLMGYARHRRYGLPIGSGVTEAACKTVFTQRIKRSGMRWGNEFGHARAHSSDMPRDEVVIIEEAVRKE